MSNPYEALRSARPDWDRTMMLIASTVAARGTCPRAHAGAVISTSEHQLLTTGYNGAPRGLPHCDLDGCIVLEGHCVRALHAEENAILQAAQLGIRIGGAVMHCTHRPCVHCAKRIIQVGLVAVHYNWDYDSDGLRTYVLDMMREAGVRFELTHVIEQGVAGADLH